jgi:predicted enzyme related to lactoylglutathione lyase
MLAVKWSRNVLVLVVLGAILGCSTTGGPDLSGMTFSDEPLVGKLVWYDLITDDADAARRFYGGLFGWTFEERGGPAGNRYLLARLGEVYVGGMVENPDPTDGTEYSRWLPFASVTDVDASVDRASSAGGDVVVAPLDVPLGRVAAIVDPEGAAIGLARSRIGDPDDSTTAPAPGRVVWSELLADDEASAAAFYGTVIGLEAVSIDRRGGMYTMLRAGGVDRAGILANPTDWEPQWLTHFGVEDLEAAVARAAELGGTVLLKPSPDVRESTLALVVDPTGAVFALTTVN